MTTFEYKTLSTKTKGLFGGNIQEVEFLKSLNELGADGWELVSTVSSNEFYGGTKLLVSIFKRVLANS